MSEPEQPKPDDELPAFEDSHAMQGSGIAAILLFIHIALTGYLAFAMYFLVRHWRGGLLAAPAMSWQYFFPAAFAILTYLPTDALTRTVARVARIAGAIALMLGLVVIIANLFGGSDAGDGYVFRVFVSFGLSAMVALAISEFLRRKLRQRLTLEPGSGGG